MGSKTSDEALREALEDANLPALLPAMAQLTGDSRWLEEPYKLQPAPNAGDHDSGGLSEEVQAQARREAFEVITAWREGRLEPAPPPKPEELPDMLSAAIGSPVPAEYGPMLAEELGTSSRDVEFSDVPEDFHVLVIGGGFSGLCAAIKLGQAGIAYTVLEKNETIGGTWLENTYPGCGVDTPSHLYSFSFAQDPGWARYFAKRGQLYEYLERLTDECGVRPNVRTRTKVKTCTWDDTAQAWQVEVDTAGTVETLIGNAIISGTGFFNQPAFPDIPGLGDFAGPCMHTAQWRDDVEIADKRIAVIGTGASAMQLVPATADTARHITVFQRSPQWGLPNPNYFRDVTESRQYLMREVPYYIEWYRLRLVYDFGDRLHPALQIDPEWPHPERSLNPISDRHRQFLTKYLESELGDQVETMRDKCLPTYPPYGKRPLLDNGWFRTVIRDDVDLVTEPVKEIRADSVVTSTGDEYAADVLVIATGFRALNVLGDIEVRGRSGQTLRSVWGEDDARAYLGITVPDFPNFFFLLGPNTFAGHGGSAALSIEMEVRYVMKLLAHMFEAGLSSVECRQEAHEQYGRELDDALGRTIWAHEGMTTYYRNSKGRIVVPMPWTNLDYWHRTVEPNLEDFHLKASVTA